MRRFEIRVGLETLCENLAMYTAPACPCGTGQVYCALPPEAPPVSVPRYRFRRTLSRNPAGKEMLLIMGFNVKS
eukprot:767760-Hanusia_phi.AAC.4